MDTALRALGRATNVEYEDVSALDPAELDDLLVTALVQASHSDRTLELAITCARVMVGEARTTLIVRRAQREIEDDIDEYVMLARGRKSVLHTDQKPR